MQKINKKLKNNKIYLAGPDVFRKKTEMFKVANELRKLCKKYGFIGLFPVEEDVPGEEKVPDNTNISLEIYSQNIKLLTESDIIIANVEPFRGPHVDDGTAYEIAYGVATGKIVYGYSNFADKPLHKIHKFWNSKLYPGYAEDYKKQFPIVEKFGKNTVNLMIQHGIESSGGKIFLTFEECLKDLCSRYNINTEILTHQGSL